LTTFNPLTTVDTSQGVYFCDESQRILTTIELDETFEVISENYPENYPNNLCQEWVISSPVGTRVKVEFLEFDVRRKNKITRLATQ